MIDSKPCFLQGVFPFEGAGYEAATLLHPTLSYTVPADRRAQLIYLRGGNSTDSMVCISLVQDGKPVRLFPVAARGATHVPLAVVEDLPPDTRIEIFIAAPAGAAGTAVVDLGIIEI
jgi:hypothetical protein